MRKSAFGRPSSGIAGASSRSSRKIKIAAQSLLCSRWGGDASEEVLLLVLVNDIACDALLGGDLQIAAIAGEDIGCPVNQHGQAAAQTNNVGQVQAKPCYPTGKATELGLAQLNDCLLYTSDAADDAPRV